MILKVEFYQQKHRKGFYYLPSVFLHFFVLIQNYVLIYSFIFKWISDTNIQTICITYIQQKVISCILLFCSKEEDTL